MTPTQDAPSGAEAMREALKRWFWREGYSPSTAADRVDQLLAPSGPIASEHARLTARAEVAEAKAENADLIAKNEWLRSESLLARALAAIADRDAARADAARMAEEVARRKKQERSLRCALKVARRRFEEIGDAEPEAARRLAAIGDADCAAALATKEPTDA